MQNVMFGMDPEFTFFDANGKPVPAHRLGYEDKYNAKPVKTDIGWTEDNAWATYVKAHRDGFNVELNPKPSACRGSQLRFLRAALRVIEYNLPKGTTVRGVAAYDIDLEDTMSDAPDDVKYFGCEPAFDSYTETPNKITIDAATHSKRYAGFHLHFGASTDPGARTEFDKQNPYPAALLNMNNYPKIGKLMDWLMGIPAAVIYNGKEQFERREHYGRAGEFRPQNYGNDFIGFEYRVLNPEIGNHHAMIQLFFGLGRYIINNFETLSKMYKDSWGPEIAKAINEGKNPEKFLVSVPGFYTPETILKLRGIPDIYKWGLPSYKGDVEIGWNEFSRRWGLTIPQEKERLLAA